MGHIGLYVKEIPDSIRLFCVLPINYGVPLFFIISGYLLAGSITNLRSRADATVFNSSMRFYFLRTLRIYPAYILWLLVFWSLSPSGLPDLIAHFFNIHNFFPQYCRSINPVFWTLAVEFQWYILAPLLIHLLLKKSSSTAIFTFCTLLLISMVSRNWVVWQYFEQNVSFNDLWRLSNEQIHIELYSFALGGLIYRYRMVTLRVPGVGVLLVWLSLLGIAICVYCFYFVIDGAGIKSLQAYEGKCLFFVITNSKYISQLLLAYLVFHYRNISLSQVFCIPIQYLAAISYSLYIIHFPILKAIVFLGQSLLLTLGIYLLCVFTLSSISYMVVEKPFLRFTQNMKQRRFLVF